MSQVDDKDFLEADQVSEENKEGSSCADGQDLQSAESTKITEAGQQPSSEVEKKGNNEQDVYKEVLEKLNLKPLEKAEEGAVQEMSMQESKVQKGQNRVQMENMIAEDFQKIENLLKLGVINPLQGQNLKNHVMKKAFDKTLQNGMSNQNPSPASIIQNKNEVFNDFNKSNPDFFNSDGRKEVLDYLKSDEVIIGKDDLSKISTMVENIEKRAIERYLKKEAYDKNLKESNDAAKQKLTANAQNSNFRDKNFSRTFTREQIGKMSGAEFAKYESLIMEQLKKGLIK